MKAVAVCLLTLAVASAAVVEGGLKRLLCGNKCNPATNAGCDFNEVCVSTNCGDHCVIPLKKREECPLVRCMWCPQGYEVDENGCQTCQCLPALQDSCPDVMCAMFCDKGFKIGSDGCPTCTCA